MIRHNDIIQNFGIGKMPWYFQQVMFRNHSVRRQRQFSPQGGVKTTPYNTGEKFFTILRAKRKEIYAVRGIIVLRKTRPFAVEHHTSRLAYLAFFSMNWRRGSTCSPIRMLKASSARSASSILIWTMTRLSGFMVVSHSWSGFISPKPL